MILDSQLQFAASQAVTADAASQNIVDIGVARNLFDGEPMAVVVAVSVAADFTTTDETYSFQIQTDADVGFGSPTTLLTQSIVAGSLTAGSTHVLPVPVGVVVEKYVRLYFDVGGTTPSVTISAYLQPLSMVQKYKSYPDGITIS